MHQRAERDGTVHHPARDDDLRACVQCSSNGLGTQVGIHAEQPRRHGLAAEHLAGVLGPQGVHLVDEVVTLDHRDVHRDPLRLQR